MNLESFSALDEQITNEDWERTPASVRRLLQWLFENYEERLADLEEDEALSKVESGAPVEESVRAPVKAQDSSCSFCGKKREEVIRMISSPHAHICNECLEICNAISEVESR